MIVNAPVGVLNVCSGTIIGYSHLDRGSLRAQEAGREELRALEQLRRSLPLSNQAVSNVQVYGLTLHALYYFILVCSVLA